METNYEPIDNISLKGQKFRGLTDKDILRPTDLVRMIIENGYDGGFDLTFKPENYRPLFWHTAESEMPGWIDKPIGDYEYSCWYEYIRIED